MVMIFWNGPPGGARYPVSVNVFAVMSDQVTRDVIILPWESSFSSIVNSLPFQCTTTSATAPLRSQILAFWLLQSSAWNSWVFVSRQRRPTTMAVCGPTVNTSSSVRVSPCGPGCQVSSPVPSSPCGISLDGSNASFSDHRPESALIRLSIELVGGGAFAPPAGLAACAPNHPGVVVITTPTVNTDINRMLVLLDRVEEIGRAHV